MKKLIFLILCFIGTNTMIAQEPEVVEAQEESVQVPFSIVDEVPIFPGCEERNDKRKCFQEMMQKHVSVNFRYPEVAQDKKTQGKVYTMFVIDKDGTITDMKTSGSNPILEEEARRIFSLLPKIKPGKQRGKVVRVPFSIPLTFKLQ